MKPWLPCIALLLLLLPCLGEAEAPEARGLAIAREADRRGNGFGDFTADMRMILRDRHGRESVREMRVQTLEVKGDGDKILTVFDSPPDVKGTVFLTYSHKTRDDDQWLYLPALKRVKRISAHNKSASFMGSEFAYEDITSEEIERYTYRWIRDEVWEGRDCFVVERYPVADSGYTRLRTWMDKREYRMEKVEYYDRKNFLLKTLTIKVYRKYLDRYWRPGEMNMINHQTGKSTRLTWSRYRFRLGLRARDFHKNRLKEW